MFKKGIDFEEGGHTCSIISHHLMDDVSIELTGTNGRIEWMVSQRYVVNPDAKLILLRSLPLYNFWNDRVPTEERNLITEVLKESLDLFNIPI